MNYIVNDGEGRLCNKLIFIANLCASILESKKKVKYYNYPLGNSFKNNQNEIDDLLIKDRKSRKNLKLFFNVFGRKIPKKFGKYKFVYTMSAKDTEGIFANCRNDIIWYGWPYFDLKNLKKYQKEIREYLEFSKDISERADRFLSEFNDSIIIGIHLRRTDYKEWRGGKYFFDDTIYKYYMQECQKIFGNNIKFILFSDDVINNDFYSEFNISRTSGSVMDDLCIMSKCNYLVSPPSTFSGWASFFGNVPRYIIEEEKAVVNKHDFKVWMLETNAWTIIK